MPEFAPEGAVARPGPLGAPGGADAPAGAQGQEASVACGRLPLPAGTLPTPAPSTELAPCKEVKHQTLGTIYDVLQRRLE